MCKALSTRLVVVTSIICYQCSVGALMCKAWLSSYPHVHGIVLRIVWVSHGCCAVCHTRGSWKEETSGSWDSEVKVYQQGYIPSQTHQRTLLSSSWLLVVTSHLWCPLACGHLTPVPWNHGCFFSLSSRGPLIRTPVITGFKGPPYSRMTSS